MREHLIPFGLVDEKTNIRGGTMKNALYEDRLIGFVDDMVEVERLKTDSDEYYEAYCAGARAVYNIITETESIKDGWNIYSRPMTLDEYKKQEELWESLGEPMTLEELAELEEVDAEVYDEGFSDGERVGHENGYNEGYDDALRYNVVLDSEMLDAIYDFKNQILDYRKEPWSENHEHNDMVFEIHKGLMELTELWVMNQVWGYWSKRNEELGD